MSTSCGHVKKAFDATATTYDALRRQLIPCFDDYYGMVAGYGTLDSQTWTATTSIWATLSSVAAKRPEP